MPQFKMRGEGLLLNLEGLVTEAPEDEEETPAARQLQKRFFMSAVSQGSSGQDKDIHKPAICREPRSNLSEKVVLPEIIQAAFQDPPSWLTS